MAVRRIVYQWTMRRHGSQDFAPLSRLPVLPVGEAEEQNRRRMLVQSVSKLSPTLGRGSPTASPSIDCASRALSGPLPTQVDANDFARRPHQVSRQQRHVARAADDIEHVHAPANTRGD